MITFGALNTRNTSLTPHGISFTANPTKLNLKSVSESLCSDYFEKRISPFDNPTFYKYLTESPKKLNTLLDKIYRRKLPAIEKTFDEGNIDKKHKVLLVDPEVTAHLDELVKFVSEKSVDTKKLTPFELREQFSEHLGTETIYRGLYSPDTEGLINTLKHDGINPQISNDRNNVLESIKYYLSAAGEPALNLFSRLGDLIRGKKSTEFMSVSSLYDVSASVAKNGTNKASTPVVVVKSEVPKLSVIKQSGYFVPRRSIDKDVLIIGDKRYDYETQREKIEAFVPFHIPTKNSEFIVDTTTPDYRWG